MISRVWRERDGWRWSIHNRDGVRIRYGVGIATYAEAKQIANETMKSMEPKQ